MVTISLEAVLNLLVPESKQFLLFLSLEKFNVTENGCSGVL